MTRPLLVALLALPALTHAAPATPAPADADQRPYTRTIKKLYPVDASGDVALDNRYGDIEYHTWDRREVKVAVTISVDAASESRAERVFDRIDVAFAATARRVDVKTSVEGKSGWSMGGGEKFEIDYDVYAPTGFDVEVHNRYGDVRLPDLAGDAEVEIRYGDLVGGDVAGDTRLTVAYGDAVLGRVGPLRADVRYGELDLARAADVTLDSRYSEMAFGHVASLALESRYDEFAIGYLGSLVNEGRYDEFAIDTLGSGEVDTRYTDLDVGYLAEAARMNLHYGDARIRDTGPGLRAIDLEGSYTDLHVRLAPALRYALEARGRYTDIDLPAGLTIVRKEKSGASESYRGYAGARDAEVTVALVGSYGSIRVE